MERNQAHFNALDHEIQPLPPSAQFESLDDLILAIQEHQRVHGAAIVRRASRTIGPLLVR
jgi:hypothetical protein